MRIGWKLGLAGMMSLIVGLAIATRSAAADVDLALVLAIDCSYSVDADEYALQIFGLAAALRHPQIHRAIASGPKKRIAISVVQWANTATQVPILPWRIIGNPASAIALAHQIEQLPRVVAGGGTSISAMLRFGYKMLENMPFSATRRVIDVVADGRNNNGHNPRPIRDFIAAQGVTINGLTILNEIKTLDLYFEDNIIAGSGRFVMIADSYAQFARAIHRKLKREISNKGISRQPPGGGRQLALRTLQKAE